MRFVFLGRVSTEDLQDPVATRQWQLSRGVLRALELPDRPGKVFGLLTPERMVGRVECLARDVSYLVKHLRYPVRLLSACCQG
jgi:hypothetical protein